VDEKAHFQPDGWDEWMRQVVGWADAKIRDVSATDQVTKLKEEAAEFAESPSIDEAIDCIVVLVYWAYKTGYGPSALAVAAFNRLRVLRARTWERQGDGTYHHA
jgi:Protein of unknown function (DUF550)